MGVTDHMAELFDRLRNDAAFRNQFSANREQAIAEYELTGHERDAVLTSDCDDLVALGLASSVSGLPSVLDCPERRRPGLSPGVIDRIRDRIDDVIRPIRDRVPLPPVELPPPFRRRPEPPQPRPRPRPGPTPGPDPPDPDRPRPGPRGGGG